MAVDYTDIGKRIRAVRLERGLTQEQLAERIATGTTHVSHIETGNTIPSLKTFLAIVNALDVSADELLCGNIEKSGAVFQGKMAEILSDCSEKELRVIAETVESLKKALRSTYEAIKTTS